MGILFNKLYNYKSIYDLLIFIKCPKCPFSILVICSFNYNYYYCNFQIYCVENGHFYIFIFIYIIYYYLYIIIYTFNKNIKYI